MPSRRFSPLNSSRDERLGGPLKIGEYKMPIRSVINTSPMNIKSGDVFVVTVAFHVGYMRDGKPAVRAYRCPYPNPELGLEDGVPQGDVISLRYVDALMEALVPVLKWANGIPDSTA